MSEFMADLHRLSEHCKYKATLDDMLRDRLLCGLRDQHLQQRLFAGTDLKYEKALEIE